MSTPAMVALETTNRAKALGGNLSGMQAPILDHRFHETDHNGGIHLGFQAPIYCRVCP